MTITDTLYVAAEEIREYIADDGDMFETYYNGLASDILHMIDEMDRLRIRINAIALPNISDADTDDILAVEREFRPHMNKKSPDISQG